MRKTKLGQELITALNELVTLPPQPSKWSPGQVSHLRKNKLNVSQPVFALYLGVASGSVKAWEQGQKKPGASARRLMDLLAREPDLILGWIKAQKCQNCGWATK